MRKIISLFSIIVLLVSCNGKQEVSFYTDQYAQGFSIEKLDKYTLIHIHYPGDRQDLQTLVLVPKSEKLPSDLPEGTLLRTPLERVVSFSNVTSGMLEELGISSTIVGVTETQYIQIPYIKQQLQEGNIADLGTPINPDIEKIMLLEPDAILINPMQGEDMTSIQKASFPIINCIDYKENSLLGQTEWIKLMGLLFGKEELADSLFRETERRYNDLKKLTANIADRPCVFTEMKYGNFWYLPGGKSYVANLLNDAGADYQWQDDTHTGTINLSFEQVLDRAENCDFWLIKRFDQSDMTYEQLTNEYPNYRLFSAYKNKNIFVCNTGKVSYYEDLPLHPDWILKDMIYIFHPELLPDYTPRYYRRLSE